MPKRTKNKGRRSHNNGKRSSSSGLNGRNPISRLWDVDAQQPPSLNNLLKLDNQVHKIVQTINIGGVLTTNNAALQTYGTAFQLQTHVNQYASLTAVFDQYRIDLVEIWLTPSFSSATQTTTSAFGIAQLYVVTDYDNANVAGFTQQNAMGYTNCAMANMRIGHYRKWRPHIASAVYGGGVFTSGFENKPSDWIDSGSPNVDHYGLKIVSDAVPTALQTTVNLTVRMHMSFRNVF